MENIKEEIDKNGFAIIKDFLNEEEVNKLKNVGRKFTHDALREGNKSVFDTVVLYQNTDKYFIESGDKIRYFYENDVFDENGDLVVDVELSLNKVGHALHILDPICKEITFNEKVKDVCRKLQLQEPVIVHSMYIYKNPKIGSKVKKHRDSTYLYTEPNSLYGFWIALDDATEENGCLRFAPGSHLEEVQKRSIRNDSSCEQFVRYEGEYREVSDDSFISAVVEKGSCVMIHGNVMHYSLQNTSHKLRNAYTFHVYDKSISNWSKDNWIQTYFPPVYEN